MRTEITLPSPPGLRRDKFLFGPFTLLTRRGWIIFRLRRFVYAVRNGTGNLPPPPQPWDSDAGGGVLVGITPIAGAETEIIDYYVITILLFRPILKRKTI